MTVCSLIKWDSLRLSVSSGHVLICLQTSSDASRLYETDMLIISKWLNFLNSIFITLERIFHKFNLCKRLEIFFLAARNEHHCQVGEWSYWSLSHVVLNSTLKSVSCTVFSIILTQVDNFCAYLHISFLVYLRFCAVLTSTSQLLLLKPNLVSLFWLFVIKGNPNLTTQNHDWTE